MSKLVPKTRKRKSNAGRKSLLDFDMERLLCTAVQLGATEAEACSAVGISTRTLTLWLAKGRKDFDSLVKERNGLSDQDVEALHGSTDPQCKYVRFFLRMQEARALRPDQVMARLPKYRDYRADIGYLKLLAARDRHEADVRRAKAEADEAEQVMTARLRKAEAEARIAEAKAAAIEEVTSTAGGIVVVGLSELLDDPRLTGPAREALELFVAEREGLGMLEARDLAGDVSDEEVEAG